MNGMQHRSQAVDADDRFDVEIEPVEPGSRR
jgi:hypothetical protein